MLHRKDNNHDEIRAVFEAYGYIVNNVSPFDGQLDMHNYHRRTWAVWFIEVKNGKYWKLTIAEARFIMRFPERSRIIACPGDAALCAIGKLDAQPTMRAAQLVIEQHSKGGLIWRR
jgi:hypothetical protein